MSLIPLTPLTPAQKKLVEDNQGLAYSYVRKFLNGSPESACYADDLKQEALLALVRAARCYDPSKARFSTYATLCMSTRVWEHRRRLNNPAEANSSRGVTAVFVKRGDMPADAEGAEVSVEAIGVKGTVYEVLLPALQRLIPKDWERHFQIWWDHTVNGLTLHNAGLKWNVSRERARQIFMKADAVFQDIAADIRQEAA